MRPIAPECPRRQKYDKLPPTEQEDYVAIPPSNFPASSTADAANEADGTKAAVAPSPMNVALPVRTAPSKADAAEATMAAAAKAAVGFVPFPIVVPLETLTPSHTPTAAAGGKQAPTAAAGGKQAGVAAATETQDDAPPDGAKAAKAARGPLRAPAPRHAADGLLPPHNTVARLPEGSVPVDLVFPVNALNVHVSTPLEQEYKKQGLTASGRGPRVSQRR